MVQFRWRSFFGPLHEQFHGGSKQEAVADVSEVAISPEVAIRPGDDESHKLSSQVLESVVAKVSGQKGDPTLPVAALARRLPEEEAANELFQLATLDKNPYMRELQAALGRAGAVSALTAALSGDGTPQAKQRSALALCAMGRNSPTNRQIIKDEIEAALIDCIRLDTGDASCVALVLDVLLQGDLCPPASIIDMLTSLSESNPADLQLQRRTAAVLQSLVQSGAISKAHVHKRAVPLLSMEWSDLIERFLAVETEGERLQGQFHADTQVMFHEEVVRHFEYEAAERCLQLQQEQASGRSRLLEVIRCLVENLEDYHTRLQARDFVWDADEQRLVPLDSALCERMSEEVCRRMEPGVILALQAAAAAGEGPQGVLTRRHARLRSECETLLDLKTEATQEHQEQAAKLRQEVVLLQAINYLEASASDASVTQVRTALSMFQMIQGKAPADAVQRLRARLRRLVTNSCADWQLNNEHGIQS